MANQVVFNFEEIPSEIFCKIYRPYAVVLFQIKGTKKFCFSKKYKSLSAIAREISSISGNLLATISYISWGKSLRGKKGW